MRESRLEPSFLRRTVFIRDTYLLNPFFFSSGTPGPGVAVALMIAQVKKIAGYSETNSASITPYDLFNPDLQAL